MLEQEIPAALAEWDNNRGRSKEKTGRKLGMSDLGGCREFIRATIAGDEGVPETRLKWPAFVGTAVGDLAETALGDTLGAVTQKWVTVLLPNGIEASGNIDALIGDHLVDFKTKPYLDEVRREGPSKQQWVQVSGYLVGLVQAGEMSPEGTASLVFLDRSGNDPVPAVFTISYEDALGYLEWASERLDQVGDALEEGWARGPLRDQPESWCHYVQCPFRVACWGEEYEPLDKIEGEDLLAAMAQYDRGRTLAKEAKAMQAEAKSTLGGFSESPVSGESEGFTLRWKESNSRWGGWTIDLRKRTT